jgi:AcrR family transcriptional regulator
MDPRARIVDGAASLLASGGRDAVTTRAVAAAAGVQAPTIYRHFGDMRRLLDAVAEHGFKTYLGEKSVREPGPDPVEDLRRGWDAHVGFGLANPALYALMYGEPGVETPAGTAARAILHEHVRRVAAAGRLRVSEELAAHMIHAAGSGTVFALLAMQHPDRRLSHVMRDSVYASILTEAPTLPAPGPAAAANALRAALPEATALSEGERLLLAEWLERLTSGSS